MQIHCKFDELLDPTTLTDHPKNPNTHSQEQIKRLAKLFTHHGVRHPIILDRQRKIIAAGHGRKQAAILAGVTAYPVVYQDFPSEEALYAFLVADNAIQEWSELDYSSIDKELPNIGPMDLDLLGLENFDVVPKEKKKKEITCPFCLQTF
jgi:ParB-like chromosome segregation protein Spo0J